MTRWETGRAEIGAMLAAGHLERVAPSGENATRLLAEATGTCARQSSSRTLIRPAGTTCCMPRPRKAMAAALAVQGLRATSAGGHLAVQEAVTAQLGRSGTVVRPFGRLRRTRNDADYPRLDTPS